MNKELETLKSIKRKYIQAISKTKFPRFTEYEKKQFNIIETALKEKETQDSVLKTFKEVIEFEQMLPHIEPNKDNGFDMMSTIRINIQRDIENKERELLRNWVLETCFPKELKALEIITNKIKIEFTNQFFGIKGNYYIIVNNDVLGAIKVDKEEYNLLKEELE